MALIQIPQPKPYIHQGPTVQQTHPVPPTSNPGPALVVAPRESVRFRVPAAVALHQGATVQATFPIPPVTVRDVQFWTPTLRDPNRLALGSGNVGPDPQFDGPTIQATFPAPIVCLPDARWAASLHALRFVVPTTRPIEGPTIQATSIFPPGQPDPRWVAGLHLWRFLVAAVPSLHQGPTLQQTFLFPVSQPGFSPAWSRALTGAGFQCEVLGVLQNDDFIYDNHLPPNPPHYRYKPTAQPVLAFPQQLAVAAAPDTLVWPPSQPRRTPFVRLVAETTLSIDGPTIQPWFLYPTSQPAPITFQLLERVRRLGGPIVQLDGPTSQQTFVFPVSQPTRNLVVLAQPRLYVPIDEAAIVLTGNEVFPNLAIDLWRWRLDRLVTPFPVATILYHTVDGTGGGGGESPSVPPIPNMSRDPDRVRVIAAGRHWVKGP